MIKSKGLSLIGQLNISDKNRFTTHVFGIEDNTSGQMAFSGSGHLIPGCSKNRKLIGTIHKPSGNPARGYTFVSNSGFDSFTRRQTDDFAGYLNFFGLGYDGYGNRKNEKI